MKAPKTPYQLGRDSFGADAINPFDDGSDAADQWEDGREHAEVEAGEEFANYCDSSMRDCYE